MSCQSAPPCTQIKTRPGAPRRTRGIVRSKTTESIDSCGSPFKYASLTIQKAHSTNHFSVINATTMPVGSQDSSMALGWNELPPRASSRDAERKKLKCPCLQGAPASDSWSARPREGPQLGYRPSHFANRWNGGKDGEDRGNIPRSGNTSRVNRAFRTESGSRAQIQNCYSGGREGRRCRSISLSLCSSSLSCLILASRSLTSDLNPSI